MDKKRLYVLLGFVLVALVLFGTTLMMKANGNVVEMDFSDKGIKFTVYEKDVKEDIKIHVEIKGQIENTGIYEMNSGDTIDDLIKKAGGVTQKADIDQISLIEKLEDGKTYYVPQVLDVSYNDNVVSEKININTCDSDMLTTLPGIGNTYAKYIIDYRETNGYFTSIDQIKNVKGIGESTFDKIKDYITIN